MDQEDQEFYWNKTGEAARDAFEDAVRDFVGTDPRLNGVMLRPEEWETDEEVSFGKEESPLVPVEEGHAAVESL